MIYKTLAVMVILFMGALSGTAGWMLTDRAYPTDILEARVLTREVSIGEELKVKYKVDRKRFCQTVVQRWIFDYNNFRYSLETKASMTPGPLGLDEYVIKVPLPEGISIGEARFRVILVFQCNPIQYFWPLVLNIPDMPFRVTH